MANSGPSNIGAAVVIGLAFVAGAWMVKSGLDGQAEQLSAVVASVGELDDAMRSGVPGRPPQRAEGPSGPDPVKEHAVDVSTAPIRGEKDAKVTIVAFSDFQCPFCGRVNPTLAKLLETYPGKVRVAFKHIDRKSVV